MCKYVIPHMKAQNYGKIVNISSVNALIGDKNDMFIRHAYNTSKAAVLGLTLGNGLFLRSVQHYRQCGLPGTVRVGNDAEYAVQIRSFLTGLQRSVSDEPAGTARGSQRSDSVFLQRCVQLCHRSACRC